MTTTTLASYDHGSLDLSKGICQACGREFKLKKGLLPRHGWTETGRRVGCYGNGVQTGRCSGAGLRPLNETNEHTRAVVASLDTQHSVLTTHAAALDAGAVPVRAKVRVTPEELPEGVKEDFRWVEYRTEYRMVVVPPGTTGGRWSDYSDYAAMARTAAWHARQEINAIEMIVKTLARLSEMHASRPAA